MLDKPSRCCCEVLPAHANANRERRLAGWPAGNASRRMVGITTTVQRRPARFTLERTLVGKARRVVDQRKK